MNLLFAAAAGSPSALVSRSTTWFIVWFVDVTAFGALLDGVADGFAANAPTLQVGNVTLVSEEFAMTQLADRGRGSEPTRGLRSFGLDEIGTVLASAGGAPFPVAWMTGHIVVIVPFVAFVAEVGFAEESIERIASVVMIILFDESNDLAEVGFAQSELLLRGFGAFSVTVDLLNFLARTARTPSIKAT